MNDNVIAISRFQRIIEWEKVKEDGVSMAFSRLGEGETYIDPTFSGNFRKSRLAGIPSGAWHIFRAKSSTPEAQARTIVNTLKEAGFTNKDAFAFEVNNKAGSNKTATKNEMANNLYNLIQRIIDSDLPVCTNNLYIKTNIDTWKNSVAWELHDDFFRKIKIWPEHWRTQPDYPETLYPWGKGNWSFWEYSSQGTIKGINGDVLISKVNPLL